MPEKHFLNAIYKDIMNPGDKAFGYNTVPGLGKQVKIKLKKGTGPKPELVVTAEADAGEDSRYLPAPVVKDRGQSGEGDANHFLVCLPDVTGVTWRVYVKKGAKPKKEVASFTTWRRLNLSAELPDRKLRGLYEKSLLIMAKSFKEAYIEVAENGLVEGGKTIKEPVDSLRTKVALEFKHAKWDDYKQRFTLTVTQQDLTGSKAWTRSGDHLKLSINTRENRFRAPDKMGGVGPVKALKVSDGDKAYFKMPKGDDTYLNDEVAHCHAIGWPTKAGVKAATLEEIRQSDGFVIDLSSAPLAAAKKALDSGGELQLEMELAMSQYGLSAGESLWGQTGVQITVYEDSTPKRLAGIMAHEISHIFDIVKESEKATDGTVPNPAYYTKEYGGQGPHCRHNAKLVATGGTTSGFIYVHDATKGPLCTMYHKVDDNVDNARFCPICLGQLRRAEMSSK